MSRVMLRDLSSAANGRSRPVRACIIVDAGQSISTLHTNGRSADVAKRPAHSRDSHASPS